MEGGRGKKQKGVFLCRAHPTWRPLFSFLFFSSPSKVFLERREGSRQGIPFSPFPFPFASPSMHNQLFGFSIRGAHPSSWLLWMEGVAGWWSQQGKKNAPIRCLEGYPHRGAPTTNLVGPVAQEPYLHKWIWKFHPGLWGLHLFLSVHWTLTFLYAIR